MKNISPHSLILVVAGTKVEFDRYAKTIAENAKESHRGLHWIDADGLRYMFVNCARQMRGLRAREVQFIGTCYHLDDIDEIEKQVPVCTRGLS